MCWSCVSFALNHRKKYVNLSKGSKYTSIGGERCNEMIPWQKNTGSLFIHRYVHTFRKNSRSPVARRTCGCHYMNDKQRHSLRLRSSYYNLPLQWVIISNYCSHKHNNHYRYFKGYRYRHGRLKNEAMLIYLGSDIITLFSQLMQVIMIKNELFNYEKSLFPGQIIQIIVNRSLN